MVNSKFKLRAATVMLIMGTVLVPVCGFLFMLKHIDGKDKKFVAENPSVLLEPVGKPIYVVTTGYGRVRHYIVKDNKNGCVYIMLGHENGNSDYANPRPLDPSRIECVTFGRITD